IRNVIGVALKHTDLAVQGVMMRKYGQEIIKATAGKKIHGTGAIPGGINKHLTVAERDGFLKDLDQMTKWAQAALDLCKRYTQEHVKELAPFGTFNSSHLSIVRKDGAMDLYDGNLRAVDENGQKLIDQVAPKDYHLPGCPPPADAIWEALVALLNNKPINLPYELLKYD
ncbi:MAG: hypothetical protein HY901_05480, partial [Deltaproteobacteria bacterium]|nr:hypothetical protein [Deltaproteobacteria bacterium]